MVAMGLTSPRAITNIYTGIQVLGSLLELVCRGSLLSTSSGTPLDDNMELHKKAHTFAKKLMAESLEQPNNERVTGPWRKLVTALAHKANSCVSCHGLVSTIAQYCGGTTSTAGLR